VLGQLCRHCRCPFKFDDCLEIWSPGKLPPPITLEWLGCDQFSRNKVIARVLVEAVLAEHAYPSRYQPIRPLLDIGAAAATGDSSLIRGTPCRQAVWLADISAMDTNLVFIHVRPGPLV
jgi:hypothetical protein